MLLRSLLVWVLMRGYRLPDQSMENKQSMSAVAGLFDNFSEPFSDTVWHLLPGWLGAHPQWCAGLCAPPSVGPSGQGWRSFHTRPDGDTTSQEDALNGAAVKVPQDLRGHVKSLQPPEGEELHFMSQTNTEYCYCCTTWPRFRLWIWLKLWTWAKWGYALICFPELQHYLNQGCFCPCCQNNGL